MDPVTTIIGAMIYLAVGFFFAKSSIKREWDEAKNNDRGVCWEGCEKDSDHVIHKTLSNMPMWGWRWPKRIIVDWAAKAVANADPDKERRIMEEIERSKREVDRLLEQEIEAEIRLKQAESRMGKLGYKPVEKYNAMEYDPYPRPYLPMGYDEYREKYD